MDEQSEAGLGIPLRVGMGRVRKDATLGLDANVGMFPGDIFSLRFLRGLSLRIILFGIGWRSDRRFGGANGAETEQAING